MDISSFQFSAEHIKAFCQRYFIRKMAFFGSFVRDDFGEEGDIDVLVEFEPNHIPGFDFFTIEAELSAMLGRKVDLQTAQFLSPEIRTSALAEMVIAYEQA